MDRVELCSLDDLETYKFFLNLLFESENPVSPLTEYLYYHQFGPEEKFNQAKRKLKDLSDALNGLEARLPEILKDIPEDIKEVKVPFYFPSMPDAYVIAVRR